MLFRKFLGWLRGPDARAIIIAVIAGIILKLLGAV
jgi:hypothetical protein